MLISPVKVPGLASQPKDLENKEAGLKDSRVHTLATNSSSSLGRGPALILSHVKTKVLGWGRPQSRGQGLGLPNQEEGSPANLCAANNSRLPTTPSTGSTFPPPLVPQPHRGSSGSQLHRAAFCCSTLSLDRSTRQEVGRRARPEGCQEAQKGSGRSWSSVEISRGTGPCDLTLYRWEIPRSESRLCSDHRGGLLWSWVSRPGFPHTSHRNLCVSVADGTPTPLPQRLDRMN